MMSSEAEAEDFAKMKVEGEEIVDKRKGIRKKSSANTRTLEDEASLVLPIINYLLEQHQSGRISDASFVGACLLAWLGARRPGGKWQNGHLATPIVVVQEHEEEDLLLLSSVPGLVQLLGGPQVLARRALTSLLSVFATMQLAAVKNPDQYVNTCMCEWLCKRRPCVLLFYIPSPLAVLKMQAKGQRVVTVFVQAHELVKKHSSLLVYMQGERFHERDPLEFTLHDLQHMEHFVKRELHLEQVGFFRCFLKLTPHPAVNKPQLFFYENGLDLALWQELEYLIADMNCHSTHLVQYLLAKLKMSCCRLGLTTERFRDIWSDVMRAFGVTAEHEARSVFLYDLFEIADGQVERGPLDAHQGEVVRSFFASCAHHI